jgi:hypothetical protein
MLSVAAAPRRRFEAAGFPPAAVAARAGIW